MIPSIAIGSLGTSISGLGASIPSTAATPAAGAGVASGGSFGDALTSAIGSLENTQANATQSAQQLATGAATDPTKAITAVENASLAMQFAGQIRNQIDTAATTIFQTTV